MVSGRSRRTSKHIYIFACALQSLLVWASLRTTLHGLLSAPYGLFVALSEYLELLPHIVHTPGWVSQKQLIGFVMYACLYTENVTISLKSKRINVYVHDGYSYSPPFLYCACTLTYTCSFSILNVQPSVD